MTGSSRWKRIKESFSGKLQHGKGRLTTWTTTGLAWSCQGVHSVWNTGSRVAASIKQNLLLAGAIAFGVVSLTALILVPKYQIPSDVENSEKRFQIENEARRTVAQIIGGLVILFGVYFTYRRVTAAEETVRVAQEQQITERFTRAVEQLGSEKLEIRLGGIYALERIAKDSPKDHWTIMEVLTAYIRENARWQERPSDRSEAEEEPAPASLNTVLEHIQRHHVIGGQEIKPPADIQAILTVVGRRARAHETREDQRLNLWGADLRGANLIEAHLEGALLVGAHLEDADLLNAHLEGANLREAHLEGARLQGTHLERANLAAARLKGAFLTGAYLEGANFLNAHLEEADLTGAIGLTLAQILGAHRDDRTRFPDDIEDEINRRDIRRQRTSENPPEAPEPEGA